MRGAIRTKYMWQATTLNNETNKLYELYSNKNKQHVAPLRTTTADNLRMNGLVLQNSPEEPI